jgi:pimeloyl-ACP methyl ester carboxylesterase
MDTSVRDHWIENAGTRLFAAETGTGQPIVLLHGGLADHRSCWLYARPLTSRFRVITPDLRGAGRSHHAGPLSWDAIADDIAAIVRGLELERVVVGGSSFGAAAAVRFALRHPSLVSALLVLNPAFGGAELGLLPAQQAAMQAVDAVGRRAPSEGIAVMFPLFEALPPEIRDRARSIVATFEPASVAATTAFMASGAQPFEHRDELRAITAPVLLVPGTDPSHPREVSDVYRESLPHALVREVELAGYADAITEFVAEVLGQCVPAIA